MTKRQVKKLLNKKVHNPMAFGNITSKYIMRLIRKDIFKKLIKPLPRGVFRKESSYIRTVQLPGSISLSTSGSIALNERIK